MASALLLRRSLSDRQQAGESAAMVSQGGEPGLFSWRVEHGTGAGMAAEASALLAQKSAAGHQGESECATRFLVSTSFWERSG
ncbi:MAG: hypothetical protein A2Z16_11100 [Chloroflexi bacterium RBG_16_54_18]|nr:MAG: hypothetical protein A2Z16_11100 [Chloroflexi bacterium RBG_16_54_18]